MDLLFTLTYVHLHQSVFEHDGQLYFFNFLIYFNYFVIIIHGPLTVFEMYTQYFYFLFSLQGGKTHC